MLIDDELRKRKKKVFLIVRNARKEINFATLMNCFISVPGDEQSLDNSHSAE